MNRNIPNPSRWGQIVAVSLVTASLVATAGLAQPATAAEYPSWAEVEGARANESSKQTQIAELTGLIAQLKVDVAAAAAESVRRGAEFETAQGAFDEATYRATNLQGQADGAAAQAASSRQTAGQFAAMLSRTGGGDLSATLLLQSSQADELLNRLGTMSKLTERMSVVYAQAAKDRNTARALTDQAQVAKAALSALAKKAETALKEAVAASNSVQATLAEEQQYSGTLQVQLAVLTQDRAATEADFAKGEEVRRAAAAASAASAAAAAAAAARPGSGGGGRDSGQLSDQGWALPIVGWISDRFGPRPSRPVAGVGAFHYGTDIAAPCGRPVYAATGGTVVYSGYLGSYGNWVLIDHGNGVQTGYAHNSSLLVGVGEQVAAGENIALVGTTGASTGCHSHFEARVDGARIDPVAFLAARGIALG